LYPDKEPIKPTPPETGLCPDGCGTLPECAPLAVPFVPFQQTSPKRYNQTDALNNGTLFPGLNLPFHMKKDAANVSGGPLGELQALEFVLLELGLYLDTHQADEEAFALFQQYAALEKAGREKYESLYGPLFQSATAGQKAFSTWIKNPWPWDLMEGGKQ
jgi:spore coat protein JB